MPAPGGTLDNSRDTGRLFPSSALAPNILKDNEGTIKELIAGPNGTATVKLSRPGFKVRAVQSFTTATGVASTGSSKKQFLQEGIDFSVSLVDKNNNSVCTLKGLTATNYSAETWIVDYSPLSAEGTIGNVSSV